MSTRYFEKESTVGKKKGKKQTPTSSSVVQGILEKLDRALECVSTGGRGALFIRVVARAEPVFRGRVGDKLGLKVLCAQTPLRHGLFLPRKGPVRLCAQPERRRLDPGNLLLFEERGGGDD